MFRIGRKYASHSYPIPRAATSVPYARNFAVGPATTVPITTVAAAIPWAIIESGAAPGINVPITPKSTGIVRIHSVVTIKNSSNAPVQAAVVAAVGGTPLPVPLSESVTIPAAGSVSLPILTETPALPIGVLANISIGVVASANGALSVVTGSSSLEVQEVQAATG
jgi:hypothetical protein